MCDGRTDKVDNNIHKKLTQFQLAEKGVQFLCNTSANYKMVSDWTKTQKKPPRNNQIRAVLTTKFKKWPWFSADDDRIKFWTQNNNRKVKKIFLKT